MGSKRDYIKGVSNIRFLKDTVVVSDLENGSRLTQSGIILPDDDMKESGIRYRWGRVFGFGPEVDYLEVGQYIAITKQRWGIGFDVEFEGQDEPIRLWHVDTKEILLVCDENPLETAKIKNYNGDVINTY